MKRGTKSALCVIYSLGLTKEDVDTYLDEKDIFEAIAKLSVPIPDEIVKKEWTIFKHSYRIDGFKLMVETDFGKRTTIAYAAKKEDMFLYLLIQQPFSHPNR